MCIAFDEEFDQLSPQELRRVEDSPALLHLRLFGRPRLCAGSQVLERFETRRSLLILARLAISRRHRMTRSELAEALWPGDFFDATRLRLRQELSRLRRGLGDHENLVVAEGETIRISQEQLRCDIDEFETKIKLASQADADVAKGILLSEAIQLSTEAFLDGDQEDWVVAHRDRLFGLRYGAMLDLSTLHLEGGRYEEALELSREAAHMQPYNEAAHLIRVQALAHLGHVADALTQLQTLRQNLESDGRKLSSKAEQLCIRLRGSASSERSILSRARFGAPAPIEAIYGRDGELSEIKRLLDARTGKARLVTLIGIGGIGKTHLMQHACQALSAQFDGRIVLVDLTDIHETQLVPDKILQALRFECTPTGDPFGRVVAFLSRASTLLALDNVEQFGSRVGVFIRKLLEAAPTLRILASSRIPLKVAGEFRFEVAPLALPSPSADPALARSSPAVQMFLDASSASGWSAPLNDRDLECISDIVTALDGIPLALQLGAVRMRSCGPCELLSMLRRGSDFLTTQIEDVPVRHRSLRSAIAGSLDQLPEALRSALSSLAVFRGGWTLEDAQQVCKLEDPQDTMERLLDASLIYVATEGRKIRFRMLEVIRTTALAAIQGIQLDDLRRRHLDWILRVTSGLSREWIGEKELVIFDTLEAEQDNVREAFNYALKHDPEAAFTLCGDLVSFWSYRTTTFEAFKMIRAAFEQHGNRVASRAMLRASYSDSVISSRLLLDDPRVPYERTIRLGIELHDRRLETRILILQAYVAQNSVRYAECQTLLDRVDELRREFDSEDEGFVMLVKATVSYFRGAYWDVAEKSKMAKAWFEARNDLFNMVKCESLVALSALEGGDCDTAESHLLALMEQVSHIRYELFVAALDFAFMKLYFRRGWFAESKRSCLAALRAYVEADAPFQIAESHYGLGRIALAVGDLVEAHAQFAEAVRGWLIDDSPDAVAMALFGSSATLWQLGERARALKLFSAGKRRGIESKARHIPFLADFAKGLESEIIGELGWQAVEACEPLTLEAAARLAALPIPAKP